ncbi:uncharacterized protein [Fopius arisanus]|uniref:Uncharacterized protein n=1 Tax=Fopius arisanus TaxID=64838 RepID=A0A9R1SZI7_9HYME|nr:PREDICTED: uncharacterized protein LOC105264705 [Fopius arisanus]
MRKYFTCAGMVEWVGRKFNHHISHGLGNTLGHLLSLCTRGFIARRQKLSQCGLHTAENRPVTTTSAKKEYCCWSLGRHVSQVNGQDRVLFAWPSPTEYPRIFPSCIIAQIASLDAAIALHPERKRRRGTKGRKLRDAVA